VFANLAFRREQPLAHRQREPQLRSRKKAAKSPATAAGSSAGAKDHLEFLDSASHSCPRKRRASRSAKVGRNGIGSGVERESNDLSAVIDGLRHAVIATESTNLDRLAVLPNDSTKLKKIRD
jgi:hypothetical protein